MSLLVWTLVKFRKSSTIWEGQYLPLGGKFQMLESPNGGFVEFRPWIPCAGPGFRIGQTYPLRDVQAV